MHRSFVSISLLALLVSVPLLGQQALGLEALHLVSWEEVPGASPNASGPVSGAVQMAGSIERTRSGLPQAFLSRCGRSKVR
ncbi:hypothetical protein JW848_08665 [Candidatus Bipolaricaulota bacterium]|nr:hypothetical protein [Candidatus Bipolaricaulota bacterium]